MSNILRDLAYAARQLRRTPGFTAVAVLTLALAVGANTAIFSVMNAVLLRTLPVQEPEQLFYVSHENSPPNINDTGNSLYTFGYNVYRRLREDRSAFSDVVAYVPLAFNKTAVRFGSDTPEEVSADEVSGNFFSALGVPMALGQPFVAADEDRHAPLAVISYGLWNRRFQRDPRVLDRSVYINGVPFTIAGVSREGFTGVESGGNATDLWIPLQNRPELPAWGVSYGDTLYGSPNWWALMLMVRLQPGLSAEGAAVRANPVFRHAAYETLGAGADKPGSPPVELQFTPAKGLGLSSPSYRDPLRVLMGMVALVLVIACVNIAMLLAARNAVREREFSLRLALGARRWSLGRQLLSESILLVGAGAVLGWLFAVQATALLARWSALQISLAPDARVLCFTLAISAASALVFGLAPLRSVVRTPASAVLRSTGPQRGAGRRAILTGNVLLTLQIALCLALLSGAGLLIRTLRNYQHIHLGMQAEQVLAFGVHPGAAAGYPEKLSFYTRLLDRLRTLPGVRSVTLAENRPGTGWSNNTDAVVDGRTYEGRDGSNNVRSNDVGPDFFSTLGTPLLMGRDLRATDTQAASGVAVVNQTFADRFLKGQIPLGHTIGRGPNPVTIVGVVADSRYSSADEAAMPMAWYSYQQAKSIQNMDVELRAATADPLALLPAIRRVVRELDPYAPVAAPLVLQAQFAQGYLLPALFARLAAGFGFLAAVLVAVGLYGTLSYRVNRRTAEIGVRMAVGASRSGIMGMILRDSLLLVVLGSAVGLPLAWFGSRLMSSMLYKLSPHDPLSLVLAAAGVLLVSLAAALVPARRAASVDPMEALRAE